MTQKQLAETLGLTPVHVNRPKQQLRIQILIVKVRKTMVIPDVMPLHEMSDFDTH